jgi:hypothetical protein
MKELKLLGLDAQYVIVVTRQIDMLIEYMENYLKRLERESDAFKTPAVIDSMIASLKAIRHKKWGDEDKARESQRGPGYVPFP